VVLGEHVREFRCGDAECDDERQVEEQLQWGRHPMLFVGIAASHATKAMRQGSGVRGLRLNVTHVQSFA
jgi:hypothetical protein